MIKVGDKVRYIGPVVTYIGRSDGKVVQVNENDSAEVQWPNLSKPTRHSLEYLAVTLSSNVTAPRYKPSSDGVRQPSHYQVFDGLESIEVIARSMTVSEFRGFCMGNVLKYRLRAGKKSELATMEKDLNKAAFYQELFDLHKGKCYAG
ncbi:nucleotide kinase [Kosakonia phage Kc166A]|uniref:Nucleotide kinase n=1 Tax=Kosakonia phage Kc166A TaxID=2801381 RepID=A0AAE7RHC6_9CAUD|nr:nucleotide kinase [Kosakonia phage Kc166A]